MIAAITIWVKHIILVLLFASFMELLLPNTGMKRFIRVIMGIFIMLTILNPVLEFVKSEQSSEHIATLSQDSVSNTNKGDITKVLDRTMNKRDELLHTAYKQDLARQITAVVKSISGVNDASAKVHITNDTNKITKIIIYVKPGDKTYKSSNINIENVVIGQTLKTPPIQEGLTEKIRQTVSELYLLSPKDIDIKLLS